MKLISFVLRRRRRAVVVVVLVEVVVGCRPSETTQDLPRSAPETETEPGPNSMFISGSQTARPAWNSPIQSFPFTAVLSPSELPLTFSSRSTQLATTVAHVIPPALKKIPFWFKRLPITMLKFLLI